MILESVIFFALLLATTLAVAVLPRTMTAHAWWFDTVLRIGACRCRSAFLLIARDQAGMTVLGIVAIALVLVMRAAQPRWSFVGAQLVVAVSAAQRLNPAQ